MATARMNMVIRHLRRTVQLQDGAARTDGQLLAAFINHKDEAAFEAILRRHGPMVMNVCRRVVFDHHDAEDACQATFLVLARKASSIWPRGMVANWLHEVAYRTALKAKTLTARRRVREKNMAPMPEPETPMHNQWPDLQHLIDQELNGVPENYRLPILLCDLEGKTIKEATQQLGWPQGTVAGRLARGRKMLAKRLTNRGVVLSAGSLAVILSRHGALTAMPTSLMNSTVKSAILIAARQATVAGLVPAKVFALMEGVMTSMMLTKLSKLVVTGLVVLSLFGLGLGGYQALRGQETRTTVTTTTTTIITKQFKTDPLLDGTWKAIRYESNGTVINPEDITLTFAQGKCVWKQGEKWLAGTYTTLIDPQGERNDMDTVFTEGVTEWKGKPAYCIYRIKGDKLHTAGILDRNVRPVTFSAPAGSFAQYGVYVRVDPKTTRRDKALEAMDEIQNEDRPLTKTTTKDSTKPIVTVPMARVETEPKEEKSLLDVETVILPPLQNGKALPSCKTPPDEGSVLRALPRSPRSVPFLYEVSRENVKIVSELLLDKIDPKRFFPLVGPAQLHQVHWKFTVTFDETIEVSYPFPIRTSRPRVQVLYIDKDHLHLCP